MPHYILKCDIDTIIQKWKDSVWNEAKSKNAHHFIYLTKTYMGFELIEINLYSVALNDHEFYKRTDAAWNQEESKGNTIWFGAWHKGINY